MEIHTVYFPGGDNCNIDFAKLRDVFAYSVAEHMPEVKLVVHEEQPCEVSQSRVYGMSSNTHKLAKWVEITDAASEPVVLCDCDLMMVKSVADAWDADFDLAYTRRGGEFPFNSGVVFVRPTPAAKAIMREWLEINDRMYADPSFHEKYRRRYAGMNQAAWGYMIERNEFPGKVAVLAPKYNACEQEWETEPDARIYHIKGRLRRACLNFRYSNRNRGLRKVVNEFRRIERAIRTNQPPVPGTEPATA